jgi:hypothetical protein
MDSPTLSSTPLSQQNIKDLFNSAGGRVDWQKTLRCADLTTSIRKD